nr:hypothetical protein P5652_01280 [Bacillus subtilis]
MWMGVAPVVMAPGTAALLAVYTPIFRWLGIPSIPLLELLQCRKLLRLHRRSSSGFAGMFPPSVMRSGIERELTRFIIACLSVAQLIYMSEVVGTLAELCDSGGAHRPNLELYFDCAGTYHRDLRPLYL